ncbi:MAG: hypothetical protein KJO11_10080 [Gemmatimonadetes bacterium]|nr:hypothetical protein [Gemmatimonadota bacterium]MBT8402741.1 hypothetical protein [Gemmatimonadota bacterium]NNK62608.1 hypothetical protein [Gemmatimonadota bacterium]
MDRDTPFDWGEHTLDEGSEFCLGLGPLTLRFARRSGEIRIAHHHEDPATEGEEPEWTRWAPMPDWSGVIRLRPSFPDRLVVVKPDQDFWLMKGARARVYLRVPLHVVIEAVGPRTRALLRVPTMTLTDTWWGTSEEGELGYGLDTRGRRELRDDVFEEHLAICPLHLENPSDDDLHVDRIALRVAHLSLFRDGDRLWSDNTRVRYLGEDAGSRIDMSGNAPEETASAELLAGPEDPRARGFSARTFARLRSSIEGLL